MIRVESLLRRLGPSIVSRRFPACNYFSFSSFSSTVSSVNLEIKEANARCKREIEVKSADDKGFGVYASRNFSKGEIVIAARALETQSEPNSHSIQTGWKRHVMMDLPARFLNHMCDPNTAVRPNDHGAYNFVALKPIQANEEVGFDYETSEYDFELACGCGAPECRKHLKGFRYHGKDVLEAHGEECVASYLLVKEK
mmetsp:Transcript_17399/g.22619  ORF Transcript_17399/g.22619 Transcript_17399/m.22619 type:complete len:198 (+) Transcript_17399:112-705(+)|eukprot:CAMPEP_0198145060 /NCGR_PEP_ID=MMETSP1443-20131203/20804_1 /TAXON_ID=186043 /ORGANISM="Entomoneis sp., Strain CCMP2396" /LENGTH=197 /DNA_ID=CAMNT_0043808579 /DNA_START=60 /DNA_END=653 /DNA_ORIENTATION=+